MASIFRTTAPGTADIVPDYNWTERELAAIASGFSKKPTGPPRDPKDKEAWKAYCIAEIARFIEARRPPNDTLSAEELGKSKQRAFLLLKSLLDLVARYYRLRPGEATVLGVAIADTIFSDTEEGCSTIAAARLAELLETTERSVRRSRQYLADTGLMHRVQKKGIGDKHWPVVRRLLTQGPITAFWWLDATSDPPAPRGRPRKTPDDRRPLFNGETPDDEHPGLNGKPRTQTSDLFEKPRTPVAKTPDTAASDELSYELSSSLREGAADAAPSSETLKAKLWNHGLAFLKRSHPDMGEALLRKRLGKLASNFGDVAVFHALAEAEIRQSVDALPYVTAILSKSPRPNGKARGGAGADEEEQLRRLRASYGDGVIDQILAERAKEGYDDA